MIALASCSELPGWEVDDEPFHQALADQGIDAAVVVWDDAAVRWEDFELVLIRTTWDYTAKHGAFVEWADHVERVSRLHNPAAVVRWNTDKTYLRELEARGVPIVPTHWVERGAATGVARVLDERGWSRGFLKPVVGASAESTMRFDRGDAPRAQAHLDELSQSVGVLVQPYFASVETRGEMSAIFIDGEISHAVRKVPVPGDYRVQDDHGASDEPYELSATETDFAHGAVKAAGFDDLLYARVDFLVDDAEEPRLVELELVEPSLFFRHGARAGAALASAIRRRLGLFQERHEPGRPGNNTGASPR